MRLEPGVRLGPYRIDAFVGAGAMGEVYRASDPRLGRTVAIKVLGTRSAPDAERLRRFEQEARAAAALTHPNVLTIHDVGVHEGLPFLVSELLEGRTLRERLDEGVLPTAEWLGIARQLAHGVAAAHALKIIHRDLKPDNLYLTADGTLKILDFGLAKLRPESAIGANDSTVAASSPGLLIGTVAYMAPEQLRAEPIDARADLFAVGVVLFEMAAGRHPFARASGAATIAAVLDDEPDLADVEIPADLRRVILRCLAKEPAERFGTAAELVCALDSARDEPAAALTAHRVASGDGDRGVLDSIAVLPFTDMSAGRDQGYLCEGLAEELIDSLTAIDGLRIAARSSSFQFRGAAVDARAVGQRLGVGGVVEGSVRKLGDRLRVSVRLIDVSDGYQRWSARFDRRLEDVFAIQDEIAESVARSLRGVLSPREVEGLQHRQTTIEAYDAFLRARQALRDWSRESLRRARSMYEQALELDPGYAPAWAGLAQVTSWLVEWWGGDEQDAAAAERASRKALELAPDMAETHAARGFALALQRRYDDAARAFEAALDINPSLFDALYGYARAAFAHGDIARSAELFRRAGDARREDYQSPILLAQSLRMLGRDDEEREALAEGIRRAERALELDPTDVRALSIGGSALGDAGQIDRALRWSERAIDLQPEDQGALVNAACLRAKLGRKEEALGLLERVFACGYGKRDWIEHDPDYDSLRDDPRFEAMLAKLH